MSDEPKKDPVISQILQLMGQVSEKLEPENSEMKDWVAENFGNPQIVELMQDATFMMLRVLDAIGQREPVNTVTIAREFGIPKGTVSKSTRRLVAQKLIIKEPLPNNKKEVLFRLTPLGRELFEAHRAFDQQMERGFIHFLNRYSGAELQFIVRLLQDLSATSFLSPAPE